MKRRSGFAVIELPAVMLVLGLVLLVLTLLIYVKVGKLAWLFLVPGGLLLAVSLALLTLIFWPHKK